MISNDDELPRLQDSILNATTGLQVYKMASGTSTVISNPNVIWDSGSWDSQNWY